MQITKQTCPEPGTKTQATEAILELQLGDVVQTPNGPGTYQGRWWQDGKVTHLIIRHTLNNCKSEDLVDIALQFGENFVVAYYPIEQVEPL